MRKLTFFVLFSMFACIVSADVLHVKMNEKGKMGAEDSNGTEIIPCKWAEVIRWGDIYRVSDGKKYGLYDEAGNEILPVKYTMISMPNCYNRAIYSLGGKQQKTTDGRAYLNGAKYGILDEKGKVLVTPLYKGLYEFSYNGSQSNALYEGWRAEYSYHYIEDTLKTDCQYVAFTKTNLNIYNAGVMDGNTGKILMPMGTSTYVMKPVNGIIRYYNQKGNKSVQCGYYNIETQKNFVAKTFSQPMDNITYWTHGDFTGTVAPVNGDKWSFIDREGNVVKTGYIRLKHSQKEKMWAALTTDSIYEVFDHDNTTIDYLDKKYHDILFVRSDDDASIFAVQKPEGKWGVVDNTGKEILPFVYDEIKAPNHDIIPVKKNNSWGLATLSGKLCVPCKYISVWTPAEKNPTNIFVEKADSLWYNFSIAKQKELPTGYKEVRSFSDKLAWVQLVNTEVPCNQLNLGLMSCTTANFPKYTHEFGNIIDVNGNIMFPLLVNLYYLPQAKKAVNSKGKALTKAEALRELLKYSSYDRTYYMAGEITEENWDY